MGPNVVTKFTEDDKNYYAYVAIESPDAKVCAKGQVSKAMLAQRLKEFQGKHGKAKVAAMMGCSSAGQLKGELALQGKAVALGEAAAMLGWSPFSIVRKARQTAERFSPSHILIRKLGLKRFSPSHQLMRRFRRGGGGGQPTQQKPEGGEGKGGGDGKGEEITDEDMQEADEQEASSDGAPLMQQFDINGEYEIGFLPLAMAAIQHRKKLAAIAKSGNPRAANAAKVLAKAKGGDKGAIKKIAVINRAAKGGNPQAKDAIKRLKAVDKMATVAVNKQGGGILSALFRDGIT